MSPQAGGPIRLKVGYKTPETLLGELTKSVGRGGVRIEAKRTVPVGTKFVFELKSVGVKESVEVNGVVQTVTEPAPGRYVLHIRYEPPKNRQGLDAVLKRIFEATEADTRRRTISMASTTLSPAADAHRRTLGKPVQPTQAPPAPSRKGSPPPRPSRPRTSL